MKDIRCPRCGKLLGRFEGRGEILCPRCRNGNIIFFDTEKNQIQTH